MAGLAISCQRELSPLVKMRQLATRRSLTEPVVESSDEELLRLVASGCREALATLYRRYQDMVFRFALHMGVSESVAEDIMQDVFLAVARGAKPNPDGEAKFSTYLYGIVRNLTRRRLRRDSRFAVLQRWINHSLEAQISTPEEAVVEDLTRQQLIHRVRHAVLNLPLRYREVVILCDLHGRDYADAAAIVGCPVGTIRSRLFRARALLAEKLGAGVGSDGQRHDHGKNW
jgi:RNA polymerase sigma-70 factor, ECF subfamily